MNIIHQRVQHRQFGAGTVTAQDENSVTVEFQSKTCRFIYPDAIVSNILPLVDASVRSAVIKETGEAKTAAINERKRIEEVNRKQLEEREAALKAQKGKKKAKLRKSAPAPDAAASCPAASAESSDSDAYPDDDP